MGDLSSSRPSSADSITTAVLPNLDLIIRGLLYLYIFALPFKRLLFIERNGFIILLVLLVLWCVVNRRHFFVRTPVDLPLIVLVVWVGISVPFATFPAYSFKEFGKLLQQGMIFYVVVYFLRDAKDRVRLLALLVGSLAVVSLCGVWEFEAKPWMGQFAPGSRAYFLIESFLPAEIWLTTYLVTLIPLSAAVAVYAAVRWQRVSAGITTGLAILCQLLTFSRAGLLALLAEAVVFAILVRKKAVTILIVGLILASVAAVAVLVVIDKHKSIPFIPGQVKFTAYNLEARLNVWRFALPKMLEHPLVGIGYGKDNFYIVTKEEQKRLTDETNMIMAAGLHNTFLDMAVGAGLPAGFAYIWLMWAIARAGLERFRSESHQLLRAWPLALVILVVGLFIRNCFDHMWIGTMALLFWVMVGLSVQPMRSSAKGVSSS